MHRSVKLLKMEAPDETILSKAQLGDPDAWRLLVDTYSGVVWAVLRSLRVQEPDRSDIYQSVFLKLTTHIGTIREPLALPGWLATVTRRQCIDMFRKQDRQPTPSEATADVEANEPLPEEQIIVDDERVAVMRSFRRLDEKCQRLLSLMFFGMEHSYSAISEIVEIPVGSIGPSRQRCLEKLSKMGEVASLRRDWSK